MVVPAVRVDVKRSPTFFQSGSKLHMPTGFLGERCPTFLLFLAIREIAIQNRVVKREEHVQTQDRERQCDSKYNLKRWIVVRARGTLRG